MARGLARQDTVPWAKLAYTWNFHVLLVQRSYHDRRRWRDASGCNWEHFDFLDPRHGTWLSASRYGAVGKIGLHMEFSCSPCAHAHTTIQGGGVTPPGAIRNTLIFWTPARHGTWLSASRYGAVGKIGLHMEFSRSPCAHAHTTIQGGGVTPPGAIGNTLIFWTPAMARGLVRQDTVPWAKLAYTWNFHVLLVHTLITRYKEVA
ncbi:hypothetical protein QL285_058342 [Trifolium repens]|nr:hypothetical protein QL285_058342 [Trifolium repens]